MSRLGGGSSGGGVASRFISQTEISEAQRQREEAVRATYARLGQEAPEEALAAARNENQTYDPRTLYERLQANRDAKQEAFDEKMKLSNQFRGIDDGESEFLAQVAQEKRSQEREKEQELLRELDEFRKASSSKEAAGGSVGPRQSPPSATSSSAVTPAGSNSKASALPSSSTSTKNKSKRKREGLLGVVKKTPAVGPKMAAKDDRQSKAQKKE